MSDQVRDQIYDTKAAVEKALKQANQKWSSWTSGVSDYLGIADNRQVLSALAQIESALRRVWFPKGTELGSIAIAESQGVGYQAALDAWVREGNAHLKNIAGISQDADTVQLSRIITDTVKASVNDVAEGAKAAAGGVAAAAVWLRANAKTVGLLLAAAVGAFLVWRFWPLVRLVFGKAKTEVAAVVPVAV